MKFNTKKRISFSIVILVSGIGVLSLSKSIFNANLHTNIRFLKESSILLSQSYYTWGGSGTDYGRAIALDSSNNAYVSGHTTSYEAQGLDMLLVKFDSKGVKWNYTWGGDGTDYGRGIALDSSNKAYVGGHTTSYGAQGWDISLVKFNSTGVEWNYTWGGSGDDYGWEIALDSSNNAYVCGNTNSFGAQGTDICLVKFNSTGVEWNYTWGGSGNDYGRAIILDSSNNAYVCGNTNSFGAQGMDICLVKFNSTGVEWNYTWGGSGNDSGWGITLDSSNNAYIGGHTTSYGAQGTDICLVKFNSTGVESNYTWGGSGTERGYGIVLDPSNNTYVCGYTSSFGVQGDDIYIVKFNSTGAESNYTWGGSGTERGYGIALDSSNNAYVCGYTSSFGAQGDDMCLVKFIFNINESDPPFDPLLFLIIFGSVVGVTIVVGIKFITKRKRIS